MVGVLFLTGLLLAVGWGRRINGEMDNAERGEDAMTRDAAVENLLVEVPILRSENANPASIIL